MAFQQKREKRATFRVAVRPHSGVSASLKLAGRSFPATVAELSSEGMLVRIELGELPPLALGTYVSVDIAFEGKTTRLQGIVRSERPGGYGIFFPERDRIGHVNPRERLSRISMQLQRGDLSQRLKVLKLPE